MAIDPRSIIGEILSRRPDLRKAYAPQAQALGIQIAGLKPAVEARRRLEAANALRSGTVPNTTLGPVPPNMGDMGAPLASASPPLPIPEFSGETRRRLTAADALRGAASPEYAGYEAQRAAMLSPMGDQGPLQPLPGSQDFGRERERALMRSPFGDQGPPEGLQPAPPGLTAGGPMPPSFGAGPGSEAARLPQFRPSFAPGTAEASLPPSLPRARPPEMGPPMPTPFAGNMPQPRPGLPTDPSLARDTSGMPPQIAELMGESAAWPGAANNSAALPYGDMGARLPRARPPQGMEIAVEPPSPGPPPPLSPDQRIANNARDVAREAVRQQAAARATQPPLGAPGQPRLLGAGTSLDLAGAGPKPPLGSTVLPDTLDPTAQFASVGQRIAPYAGAGPTLPSTPDLIARPAAGTMPTARLPRPRPDFNQPGDLIAKPAGTAPLGTVTGADLPPPGQSSSILTPQQIQRTMGAQALYNAPTGIPPPVVTGPMPGWKPEDTSNLTTKKLYDRTIERGFGSRENLSRDRWGRAIGAGLGGLLGFAGGGPGGAATLGSLGYRLGDNAARGIANLRRPPIGVEPITPPPDIPVSQPATGGIFGRGMRGLGQKAQGILAQVASGRISPEAAAKTLNTTVDHIHDSLNSFGGGGGGQYGGGFGGGGGYGGGGTYGGSGGGGINQGIGGAFRNR